MDKCQPYKEYFNRSGPRTIRYKEHKNELNNKLHREDGPALVFYYANGNVFKKKWFFNGKLHRLDGPASKFYKENGECMSKEWWVEDKLHRTDGPAIVVSDLPPTWYWMGTELEHKDQHPFNIFKKEYKLSNNINEWSKEFRSLFFVKYF